MNMVQVTTWNDYEEGTAVEPGVDNCGSLQISVQLAKGLLCRSENGEPAARQLHVAVFASLH
jgi:hypothetical protein